MSILQIHNVGKYYGAEHIFSNVGFNVARGERVAIVGVNGAGKSTLLRIIAGEESASSGAISPARGIRMAYLAQEARFDEHQTLRGLCDEALQNLHAMRHEIDTLEAAIADTDHPAWAERMERYGELLAHFEHAGGYDIERTVARVLEGLGFDPAYHGPLRLAQFSGGMKTRAALAAILLSSPDILLLDEPTNHLDLAALEWLERFIKQWDGTLMVVSHDRYFLDRVTTRTIEIAFGRLDGDYPGGYMKYQQLKAERMELQWKQYQAQQEEIARMESFIRRYKNSTLSTQARGRERRLQRLKEGWEGGSGRNETVLSRPEQQRKLTLAMQANQRGGDIVFAFERLGIGYVLPNNQHTTLLSIPELQLRRQQRVALMGPNGAGKTTLLRTMVGELPPLRGHAHLGSNVKINYYAQSHEGLVMSNTILDEMRRIRPTIKETEARTFLGRFLFSGDDVFKRVGDLSGGERGRVALAQLTLIGGNLLILDEPTNHLDIGAREALEDVLNEYDGTLLFVSHDRYFIDAVADTLWIVDNGAITVFDGNYSEYREELEQREKKATALATPNVPKAVATSNPSRPTAAPATREQEREARKRQRRGEQLEQEIATLEAERQTVATSLSGQETDPKKIAALAARYSELEQLLQMRYDEWAAIAG
ncbi:MAG: ABC-F family ATP-binding cassette domain-containing protein [Chloroflexaceae bacterium]|jgi:ATP-binding cassette subfamily F protein 3|nr:ABC-F family ATP-binding cassette domain-containing protein [Chloroflexaceae bacterium]